MRIKIVSEGLGKGTKIINADTGELVEGVTEATWHCAVNGVATVELKMLNVPVEVIGERIDNILEKKDKGENEGKSVA